MKLNKKGFTLVELLATLTILSIIMMIAVPNVMNILDKNKRTTYLEDAKKLVTLADYKFRKEQTIAKPNTGECVVYRMSSLDVSELKKGPEGSAYNTAESFVAITYSGGKYQYAVRLAEQKNKRGVKFVNSEKLIEEVAMMRYVVENTPVINLGNGRTISGEGFSSCRIVSMN